MPVRMLGEHLNRWGSTAQRPIRNACEQRPAAVRLWRDEERLPIVVRDKTRLAQIHLGDDSGLHSDHACRGGVRRRPRFRWCGLETKRIYLLRGSRTSTVSLRWWVSASAPAGASNSTGGSEGLAKVIRHVVDRNRCWSKGHMECSAFKLVSPRHKPSGFVPSGDTSKPQRANNRFLAPRICHQ